MAIFRIQPPTPIAELIASAAPTMDSTTTIAWYNANASTLVATYERLPAERVHHWLIDLLPGPGACALDVGAGSGRDAAWMASRGLEVTAAEPAQSMRESALRIHANLAVQWVNDALPDLRHVLQRGISFDFILLSAVWMHLPESQRPQAFSNLIALLKPGGTLAMSLRKGPPNENRPGMHAVSEAEVEHLAGAHGAVIIRRINALDLERPEVSWIQLAIRLADANAVIASSGGSDSATPTGTIN